MNLLTARRNNKPELHTYFKKNTNVILNFNYIKLILTFFKQGVWGDGAALKFNLSIGIARGE
jgi:hypothetical protein